MSKPILANSFSEEEVIAIDTLLTKLRSGADVRIIVRDPAIASAHRKFLSMREKARRHAS